MPRNRSSSESSDSRSSVEYKSKRKSYKSRRKSSSSSSSRSKSRGDDSSSSNEPFKKSKKYSKSKKSRSRSPKSVGPKPKFKDIEEGRTKNFDFEESLNDLYKNEKTRLKSIDKLEESSGFQPKSFKSSRSNRKKDDSSKFRFDSVNENVIFGTSSQNLSQSAEALISPSIISSSNKTIMSDLFYEDTKMRQNRWKLRMMELLSAK